MGWSGPGQFWGRSCRVPGVMRTARHPLLQDKMWTISIDPPRWEAEVYHWPEQMPQCLGNVGRDGRGAAHVGVRVASCRERSGVNDKLAVLWWYIRDSVSGSTRLPPTSPHSLPPFPTQYPKCSPPSAPSHWRPSPLRLHSLSLISKLERTTRPLSLLLG